MSNVYVTVSRLSSTTEQIQTSADGCLTWTARSSGIDNFGGTCINFGNGLFVALGLDAADGVTWIAVVSDDDGATWTSYSIPQPANQYRSIVYAPELSLWLALGDQGEVITAPATADSWTLVTTLLPVPNNDGWTCVEWAAGTFVVVGSADGSLSNVVRTSTDSFIWVPQLSLVRWWTSVRYHDGLFVAVNSGAPDLAARNMTSPNGAAPWTQRTSPAADQWLSVDKGAGIWLAVSNNSPQMQYSATTITWALNSVTDSDNSWFVRFAGDQFVVCKDDPTNSGLTIMTSADGLTGWVFQTTAMPDGTRQVAYSAAAPPAADFGNLWRGSTQTAGNTFC